MKKFLLAGIVFFLFSQLTEAQTLGGSLMLASPKGEFRENVDRLGYGFQVQGTLWEPSKLRPYTMGLNFGYLIYGENTSRRPLSTTIPDVFVEVSTNNTIANFHLFFQVSPFFGTWRPYAEGLFGGAYISTQTSVESEQKSENVFESTNFDDFAWSYGYGGGLMIRVSKAPLKLSEIYLDLKARYLYGSNAEYLKEGSIQIVNGRANYNVSESKTDLLSFHVGVIAFFN